MYTAYPTTGLVHVHNEGHSVVRQEITVFPGFIIDGDQETASLVDVADRNNMRRPVRANRRQSSQFIPLQETFLSLAELHQMHHPKRRHSSQRNEGRERLDVFGSEEMKSRMSTRERRQSPNCGNPVTRSLPSMDVFFRCSVLSI